MEPEERIAELEAEVTRLKALLTEAMVFVPHSLRSKEAMEVLYQEFIKGDWQTQIPS